MLFGVTAGRRKEADWLFREGLQPLFPEQWERRRAALPDAIGTSDIVAAYRRCSTIPTRRFGPAALEWCMWESATPTGRPRPGLASRYTDPASRWRSPAW